MSDEEMNFAVEDIAARFTLDPATGKWTREHKREKLTIDLVATTIERDNWGKTAAHYLDGMHYYRGLVQSIGETIGEAAYLQDDGGKVDSVLCAKVPELVVELKRERDEARAVANELADIASHCLGWHDHESGETAEKITNALKRWRNLQNK